jgi:putative ABC transport system permease protein
MILIQFALPWFNQLTGKALEVNYLENWVLLAGLLAIGLVVGVLAGSYPAFVLSVFRPTEVLSGTVGRGAGGSMLRRILVVSQFVVSMVLLICIGVVYNQLHYMQSKDLGFDKEQIVLVNMYGNLFRQYGAFKSDLLQDSRVSGVTRVGGSIPGYETEFENAFIPEGFPQEEHQWLGAMWISHDMEEVLGLEFTEGGPVQVSSSSDSAGGFILNETAARFLDWQDNAVGKRISHVGGQGNVTEGQIIGVVKDFHFRPLNEPIKPLVLRHGGNLMAIKISAADMPGSLDVIERTWNKFVPDWPMSHQFLDENIEKLYGEQQKFARIIQSFALLGVFIACLGLLGLASFTTERRRKEIGVRKVVGATTTELLLLLSKEFSKLVLIAFAIAAPLGYIAGNSWLQDFAFRAQIGLAVFLLPGLIAFTIALATVSYHTVRAALVNPTESLKYE